MQKTSRATKIIIRWIPAIMVMTVIFWASSQPNYSFDEMQLVDIIIKKGGHFAGYFLLFLGFQRGFGKGFKWGLFLSILMTVVYAITDEYHQLFVHGRSGQVSDILIDTAGALLALICYKRHSLLRRWVHFE